jgi:exodeoxyribonuclease VII large subunit
VVPDVGEELTRVSHARDRLRAAMATWLAREQQRLDAIRARPCLDDPTGVLLDRTREVEELRDRARRTLGHRLDHAHSDLTHQLARVRGLSPLATLRRGYAVVQDADGHVVTSVGSVTEDSELQVRVYDGRMGVVVRSTTPEPTPDEESVDE